MPTSKNSTSLNRTARVSRTDHVGPAMASAESLNVRWRVAGTLSATPTGLQDINTVAAIKNLKINGSSAVVKVGTKIKNIRLVEGDHDIDCKIDASTQCSSNRRVCEKSIRKHELSPLTISENGQCFHHIKSPLLDD